MKIGNVKIENNLFLAPMAGIADRAFREICKNFGAGYVTSEMVSAKGLVMNDRKSKELLCLGSDEQPAGVQIFGDDPQIMAEAAKMCLNYSPKTIDINMGCPAPKITNNGCGSALMKNPKLAEKIISAVSLAVDIPVTVKIRKGWNDSSINAVQMAQIAENSGAKAVFIHARTKEQMYSGKADLDIIYQIKKSVSIPVIGNGDIADQQSAAIMMETTGCDGIMIGRGALGNPWIFRQINAYLTECKVVPPPGIYEKMAVMLKQISKTIEYKGEKIAMNEARHHAAYYTKGLRGGAAYRREICALSTFEQLSKLALKIIEDNKNDF